MSARLNLSAFVQDGTTLYKWLGTFWTRLYRDREFLRGLQEGRSLKTAQVYLNMLEALAKLDRKNAPVFHRERWYPLIVKKAQRNQGKAVALRFGDPGAVFGGENLVFGGTFVKSGLVSYPTENIQGIATCIVDSIVNPSVTLISGEDFVYRDGTLIFKDKDDPFGINAPNFAVTAVEDDEEAVIWACNALKDEDLVYKSVGYALNLASVSSEHYKTVLNAVWDVLSDGASMGLLKSLLGAIYGLPTCINDTETVELVQSDGLVVTDANVYLTDPDFAYLMPGQVLKRGDSMDSRLRVYAHPFQYTGVGADSCNTQLVDSITHLRLPKGMLSDTLSAGLTLRWDSVPVYEYGTDTNANWKVRFRLSNIGTDDDSFWTSFWSRCEAENINGFACFQNAIDATIYPDDAENVVGRISPLRWYLEEFAGPSTLLVWVKPVTGGQFSDLVQKLLPATVRLVIVEAATAAEEELEANAVTDAYEDAAVITMSPDVLQDTQADDNIAAMKWVNGSK